MGLRFESWDSFRHCNKVFNCSVHSIDFFRLVERVVFFFFVSLLWICHFVLSVYVPRVLWFTSFLFRINERGVVCFGRIWKTIFTLLSKIVFQNYFQKHFLISFSRSVKLITLEGLFKLAQFFC